MTARRTVFTAAVLSIALARFASGSAVAESRLRVLIVVDESDDPFAERIKAEVSALGLEVVAIEPWRTGETVESLDAAGRANQAAAAIRMISSRKGVEVWMANQPTGRSLLRQLVVDERPGTPSEGLVALQTAELLRTTLLSRSEVAAAAPPKSAPPAALAEIVTPPPPPRPPSVSLQAAAGVLSSPGVDPAMQLWITVSHVIARPFGVALDVSVPLGSGTISGPEGSANVRAWLVGATIFVRREPPESRLYAIGAAGAAVIRLNAQATANPPLLANSASATAGAIYLRADGGVKATDWLRIGLRAVAGAVPQGVTVRFAGNEAATWGRPFLAGLALADLSW